MEIRKYSFFIWLVFIACTVVYSDHFIQATASTTFSAREGHTSVVFNNRVWVIGGFGASGVMNDVWCSSDGVTWTRIIVHAQFPERYCHASVVFDDRIWIIGGYDPGNSLVFNDVWYSSDGMSWYQATDNALFTHRKDHSCVVFNNRIWVIGGIRKTGRYDWRFSNDAWYSTDGITWTQATADAQFSPRADQSSFIYNDRMWILGGAVNLDNGLAINDIWYSSDGTNWFLATGETPFLARLGHQSITFNNRIWLIGGWSGGRDGRFLSDIWNTDDGVNWNQVNSNDDLSARSGHSCVVFNNRLWIIGGRLRNIGLTNSVCYLQE